MTTFVMSPPSGFSPLPITVGWNPGDQVNMSVNGFNATATAANAGVRASQGFTSGKYYFEIFTLNATNTNSGFGVANSTANLGSVGATPTNAAILYRSGAIWVNNTNTGITDGTFGPAVGATCGCAVDFGAKLIWFRNATAPTNWNGSTSNDPAAGTGGVSFSAITGPYFPFYTAAANGEATSVNFSQSGWFFGDGFDTYATGMDSTTFWDAATSNMTGAGGPTPGRFGGQAIGIQGNNYLTKTSGANDSVHHIAMGVSPTASGTQLEMYFQFMDGATIQCTVCVYNDLSVKIFNGGRTGTLLATAAGTSPGVGSWTGLEVEVTIHNTAGTFAVRRNGATVNDYSATGLNTRNTANNFANRLTWGLDGGGNYMYIDDFFWRSDTPSVPWMGDLRCYTRTPLSDVQAQFARNGVRSMIRNDGGFGQSAGVDYTIFAKITSLCDGRISQATLSFGGSGPGGHIKCAVYTDNGGLPGTVLGLATNIFNPGAAPSPFVFTFSPTISVAIGQVLWLGFCSDANFGSFYLCGGSGGFDLTSTGSYASFPTSNPPAVSHGGMPQCTIVVSPANSGCVNEAVEDGTNTYVYDNNIGDNDWYSIQSIPPTLPVIYAVTVRGFMQKSDTGARTGAMQAKSGATVYNTPNVPLSNTGWLTAWRTDPADPNTGAAWTPAAVNALQIGPKVVA